MYGNTILNIFYTPLFISAPSGVRRIYFSRGRNKFRGGRKKMRGGRITPEVRDFFFCPPGRNQFCPPAEFNSAPSAEFNSAPYAEFDFAPGAEQTREGAENLIIPRKRGRNI